MTIDEFSTKHGVCGSAIHVAISQSDVPRHVLYKPKGENHWHVQEEWFLRRKRFQEKVKLYCQDMYYLFLHSGQTTEMRLAEVVGLSQPWFKLQLFRIDNGSILKTKISKGTWKFFRFCRKVERTLSRRCNIRFDIEKILDEEAKIWERREEEEKMQLLSMNHLSTLIHQNEMLSLLKNG